MDLNDKLVMQLREARLNEVEMWLALLIIQHGSRQDDSATPHWRYEMTFEEASRLRAVLPRGGDANVIITGNEDGVVVLDLL